jgi:hypothetical protein
MAIGGVPLAATWVTDLAEPAYTVLVYGGDEHWTTEEW